MRAKFLPSVGVIGLVLILMVACGGEETVTPPPATKVPPPPPKPPAQLLPDLVITSHTLHTSGASGEFPVTFEVTNQGNAEYQARINVGCPGNWIGGFNGLKPGESKTAVVNAMLYGSSGTRMTFKCMVDPDNVIKESNETNNQSGVVTVEVQ